MQGTGDQKKCSGDEVLRIDQTCISRNQRDTLWTSWNVVCKLVLVWFCPNVKSMFCTVSFRVEFGIVYIRQMNNSQGARAIRIIVPHSTRLCLRARASWSVQTAITRRRTSPSVVDTTTVHHQSRNLSASLANQAGKTELDSDATECRQLRHRRLLLFQFLLQMTILPHVSDDRCQDMRDMFDSSLSKNSAFAMKTSCLPCDFPSGRVVHPPSV